MARSLASSSSSQRSAASTISSKPGLVDAVDVPRRPAVLVVAAHIGVRLLAVAHAVIVGVGLHGVAVLAVAVPVAGLLHGLAVLAILLVVAKGRLLAALLVLLLAVIGRVVVIFAVAVAVVRAGVAKLGLKRAYHLACKLREFLLVVKRIAKPVDKVAGPAVHPAAPQIKAHLELVRRRRAGETLAKKKADNIGKTGLDAFLGPAKFAPLIALVKRGAQILRDAGHLARAKRVDAGALRRLEDGARALKGRAQLSVRRHVVMCKPQRRRIGGAPQAGALLGGGARRQGREAHLGLADMAVGPGESHLVVDPAADGAKRCCRGFEKLLKRVMIAHCVRPWPRWSG